MRAFIALGVLCGLPVALASCIVLNGYPLVLVGLAAALAAAVAYFVADRARDGDPTAAAVKAATAAVSLILVVAGLVVLADGIVAASVLGLAVVGGGAVWLLRAGRGWRARRDTVHQAVAKDRAGAPMLVGAWLSAQPPVSLQSTATLGSEWLWTTAALGRHMEPAVQQAVIQRRQENLDELERRDPAGLARWLADGAAATTDPARFVRTDPTMGTDAA